MNMNAIAHGKLRFIGLLLFFFNSIDDAVHRVSPRLAGEHFQAKRLKLQTKARRKTRTGDVDLKRGGWLCFEVRPL